MHEKKKKNERVIEWPLITWLLASSEVWLDDA